MEEKIKELASALTKAYQLKNAIQDKEYWIKRAQKETDFVPAEGDWIHVEVSLFHIEVGVHHKEYGNAVIWKNGIWTKNYFEANYPDIETLQ